MRLKVILSASFLLVALGLILFTHTQSKESKVDPNIALPPPGVKPDYLIILVGDSMTESLGNSDEIRQNLAAYYPGKTFDIYNYGFGSTNILSVPERLTKWTNYHRDFQPVLDIDSSLIILESMGHNPLSDYPLDVGLKKQTETLDQIVSLTREKRTNTKLVFITTIAPNSKKYGQGSTDLSDEKRKEWVSERNAYMKNHMEYAKSKNIPLIDVFTKSLKNGDGNLEYVDTISYIHPSPKGIILISKEIADFIYQNKLLN